MVKFANRVKVAITQNSGSWPGTGTVYLGAAAAGYQSIPTSLNGETIRFVLEHGTDWEIGSGTFNSSAQTVTRSLASSSTGSLLDIDGAANIFISPSAEDLQYVEVYSSTSDLPAASSNHGRIAHVHGDGAMYFAHGGSWIRLGNHSDITTYSAATTSADGLLSASDKTKLDGVSTSANNYALPTASASALGGIKIGTGLSIDGSGVVTASGGSSSSSGGSLVPITTTKTEVSSDGETAFTGSWKAENISVFLNGVKLQDSEVTATDTQVTISATAAGDIVEVVEYGAPFASPYASTFPIVTTGATFVTVNYTVDKVAVYKNGVKLRGGGVDFTATNGTTITGFSAFVSGDVVEVVEHGSLASTPNNIVDLSDTPSSLGTAGQVLQVNSGANALEFADAATGGGVTSYTGKSGTDGTPSGATYIDNISSPSEGDLAYDLTADQLYLRTTSAWKRVSVGVDETPVVTTEPPTTHALNSDGSTSTVTMVAYDPEGFGITYGIAYPTAANALPNQLANATSITQNTGVFTFDPSTSSSHAGNVNVRLSASDGISTTTRIVALSLAFPINHGARGIHFIAYTPAIDYFAIATPANAADFGDQSASVGLSNACSNGTRALRNGGGWINTIDYITVATLGNATTFGYLSNTLGQHASVSNGTYGLMAGGRLGSVNGVNNIEYVTIATEGNSSDFGDLTGATRTNGGAANTTHALIAGGQSRTAIDKITMATTSNATSFGNLLGSNTSYVAGAADSTRAIWKMGGSSNEIQYNTIASAGNATDFGDASVARSGCGACSDYTYAVISGGGANNTLDRVVIQTTGNATDFGDLTANSDNGCSTSGAAA